MKQVFLSGKGQIEVIESPVPSRLKGGLLVQTAYSLISAGTEGAAVTRKDGVLGVYEKILKSADRADQVWEMVKAQGARNTLALIENKLSDYTPIGYSAAGVVIEVDSERVGFQPGQRVACMGTGFANHAEFLTVPQNLAVAIPDNVDFEQAAFAAIACIAMQGIRRLELSPGEVIVVVGLGLIGQVALRLATAMGYQTLAIDIDDKRVAHAGKFNPATRVFSATEGDSVEWVHDHSSGRGADGVLISASAKDDAIINQAFDMCRRRGRVSVVGDIGLGLERAKMYAKELEVRLSCSYGVGRYDNSYEIDGQDYPLPYVRWTERRNLEYFISLLASGRVDLGDLVSQKVEVTDAKKAYSELKIGNSDIFGVLLDYALPDRPQVSKDGTTARYSEADTHEGELRVAMIGVGAYAKNVHLPNILKLDNTTVQAVVSRSGGSAAVAAKKAGASYASSDVEVVLNDVDVDAVIISTRHASHAALAIRALEHGKHVFVEKPLATTTEDCLRIVRAQQASGRILRVGFNRRFSPLLRQMKGAIGEGKRVLNVRVNVGSIGEHWSNSRSEGGRLLGEGVHFFDLANWIIGSAPETVTAQFLGKPSSLNPDVSMTIRYECGSVANVSYITVGHTAQGKEFFELFGNGRSVVVDNYKSIKAYGAHVRSRRKWTNDKGQFGVLEEFSEAIRTGVIGDGADAEAGLQATAIAEAAVRSAVEREFISVDQHIHDKGAGSPPAA